MGVEEAGLRAGGCQSLGAPVGVRNKHTRCYEAPPLTGRTLISDLQPSPRPGVW